MPQKWKVTAIITKKLEIFSLVQFGGAIHVEFVDFVPTPALEFFVQLNPFKKYKHESPVYRLPTNCCVVAGIKKLFD